MTNRTNADFFQVLLGQVREDPFVDLVLAESRLVFFEAKAPQPDHHVHDGAHNQRWRPSSSGEARVSRVALEFSGLRKARWGLMQWPVFNSYLKSPGGGRKS
jgi:hypothetical protein